MRFIVYLVNGSGERVASVPASTDQEVLDAVCDILDGTLDMEYRIEIVRTA